MVAGSGPLETHSSEYTVRLEVITGNPRLEIDFINLPLETEAERSSWGSVKNRYSR